MQIPVYVGCSFPLLGDVHPASAYHGNDGFGDVPDPNAPDASHLQSEHAVQALLRMSKEHRGKDIGEVMSRIDRKIVDDEIDDFVIFN